MKFWNFKKKKKKKKIKFILKSVKIFCEIFEKNSINQARFNKRTGLSNEVSKFHKKISNLFFKNLQKFKRVW